MKRILMAAATAAIALAGASTSALAQQALTWPPPPDQQLCMFWTAKLERGIEVIGAPAAEIDKARNQLAGAKSQQQAGKWYACSVAAKSGLDTLKAG